MGKKKFRKFVASDYENQPQQSQAQQAQPQPTSSGVGTSSQQLQPQPTSSGVGTSSQQLSMKSETPQTQLGEKVSEHEVPESVSTEGLQQGTKSKGSRKKKTWGKETRSTDEQLQISAANQGTQQISSDQGNVLQQHSGGQHRGPQQSRDEQPIVKPSDRPSSDQQRGPQQPWPQQPTGVQQQGPQQSRGDQQRGTQQPSGYQQRGSQQYGGAQQTGHSWGTQQSGYQQQNPQQPPSGVWQGGPQQSRGDQQRGPQQPSGNQPQRGPEQPSGNRPQRGPEQPSRNQPQRGPQQSGGTQQTGSKHPWGIQQSSGLQQGPQQPSGPQQSRGGQQRGPQKPSDNQQKGFQQSGSHQRFAAEQGRSVQEAGDTRQRIAGDQQVRRDQQSLIQSAGKQQFEGEKATSIRSTQGGDRQRPTQKQVTSELQLAIPQRKKLNTAGSLGRRIRIETNHLALTLKNLKTAIHYDVAINPETPKKLLRVAVETFRRKHFPNRYPAFDGFKNMYSSSALPISNPFSDEVMVTEDDREKKFSITIKFAAEVDLSVVSKYFEAVTKDRHMVTPQEAVQCLDIVLRSAPSLNCIPVGRSFFTRPTGRIIDLGDGMEMYYGFYQSAVLGWKPFLNVDVSHKAFPKCGNVLDVITELCPRVDLQSPLKPYERETVDKFLRTLKVQYEIPNFPATKRVMRVNQLDKPAIDAKFRAENGKQQTVAEYFQTEKKFRLKYPHLPCLWVGSKQREQKILLPIELCTILPGQVTNRTMTATQTSNMIKVAATPTTVRKDKIMQSVRQARYNDDPTVREFGFSVSNDFAQIEARILDSPVLTYSNKQEKPRKGVWRAQKFLNGVQLKEQWAIVSIDDRTNINGLNEFIQMLTQCGRDVGMEINRPTICTSIRLQYRKEKDQLEAFFNECSKLLLVIVVIPTDSKDAYNYVKQVAELRVGTLTQCIKGRNVFRPKPATVGNILLKVNAKLNGVNHALYVKPECLKRPCMIMGADVTHPSPESRGTVPSVAAVTASHDPRAFQYNICWRLQPPTQEIIGDLENIVKEHLLYFYQRNKGIKPDKIIFFRDGVSEGQFQIVLNSEIAAIRRACSTMGDGGYAPKITFLVVQKRHHTRFFPINSQDSEDRNFNVPAGTVVDTEITHPTALDFYLVSHASIQGVSRPTKYRMLWDDNDMNEDELEQLTYHLCHLFTRCTRSVSYPAPTYYAHLAAARAKVYCERRQINMDALEREFRDLTIRKEVVKDSPMFFV